MTDDLIRRKDALNFEITVEGPREAEEAILRTSQGIMDYIKSLPAAGEAPIICRDCRNWHTIIHHAAFGICTAWSEIETTPRGGHCYKSKRRENVGDQEIPFL